MKNTVWDPLHFNESNFGSKRNVELGSGLKVVNELKSLVKKNEPIANVLHADEQVMEHFNEVFPEVIKSNETGTITPDKFSLWKAGNNNITIELDNSSEEVIQQKFDVYIGGPASAVGAALQAKSGESTRNIIYGHDGRRVTSNWKGSASYFHIRDAVPVYYWPDNHGAYTIYATVKHFLERNFNTKKYFKDIATDPNWNKLRVNWINCLKDPSIFWLFAKNQFYALQDVGFHIKGTELRDRSEQTARTTCRTAALSEHIFNHLNEGYEKPLFLHNPNAYSGKKFDGKEDDIGDAIYTFAGSEEEVQTTMNVINNLKSIAGDDLLEHHFLSKEEIAARGYDSAHVKQAAIFPKDGVFPPYLDQALEDIVTDNGGNVLDHMQLKKILVKPKEAANGAEDIQVSKILWENTQNGEQYITPINSLYLSLGPSMKSLTVNLPPHLESLGTKLQSSFGGANLMGQMMWASAASIVFLVRVDCSKVPEKGLRCFRDHIDGHNKHIIRLGEKDVHMGGKKYKYFAMQSTGGGHFPSKNAHAETALNVFQANIIPILGLDRDGIEYDILQVRSCARGVSAQNALRMSAPASNMVMVYGLGGIGMSTMAANGLLMKAIMALRQKLSVGAIDEETYKVSLKTSDFSSILHWNKPNPFRQNYAQFTDNVGNPKFLAKKFGLRTTAPPTMAKPMINLLRMVRRV